MTTDRERTDYVCKVIKSCRTSDHLLVAGYWTAKQMARLSRNLEGLTNSYRISTAFKIHQAKLFPDLHDQIVVL